MREVCGVQAQVFTAAALGLRARSHGLPMQDVSGALNQERSIVRTWLMRGTLHMIASDDLGWMLGVLGPVFAAGNQRRHAELGLDAALKTRGVAAIRRVLSDAGPLTRHEIVDRLRQTGIRLDPKTQAPIHLIQVAALQGVLCLGPDRTNGEPTYVLIDQWIGAVRSRSAEAQLGELARRYFVAYGPATLDDFVVWSGLPVGQARSAMAAAKKTLADVTIHGQPAFVPRGRLTSWGERPPTKASVRLLPAFDTYLLGYRSRDLAVAPPLQRRLQRGGGWLYPAVVVNGKAVAAWTLRRSGGRGHIFVEPYEPITRAVGAAIEAEVADIGRFLDLLLGPHGSHHPALPS